MTTKYKTTLVRLLVSVFFGVLASSGIAQVGSSNRDNPTPLNSSELKGTGVGKKAEYFYSFSGGPGEVTITIDLKAKAGSTNADVEIFDAEGNKIFYHYPNATTQNERAVKKFSVDNKQILTLRLAFDSSAGEYSIKLGGAVELMTPESISQPSSSAEPQTEIPVDPSVAKPKGNKVDFGINIMQAVGNQFGLPTSGVLRIVMKDGSVQDIDLSNVKSASIKKQ